MAIRETWEVDTPYVAPCAMQYVWVEHLVCAELSPHNRDPRLMTSRPRIRSQVCRLIRNTMPCQ